MLYTKTNGSYMKIACVYHGVELKHNSSQHSNTQGIHRIKRVRASQFHTHT